MYMSMGMTFDEYWHSSFDRYKYYRKAWKAKREEENRRDWLLGAYFYNAVGTALGNAFRKKGQRAQNYLEEPFPIFPLTKEQAAEKEAREIERMDEQLHAWVQRMKAQEEITNASTGPTDNRDNGGHIESDEGNIEPGEIPEQPEPGGECQQDS